MKWLLIIGLKKKIKKISAVSNKIYTKYAVYFFFKKRKCKNVVGSDSIY